MSISQMMRSIVSLRFLVATISGSGCSRQAEPLIVYSGKGLKNAVDEITAEYEKRYGVPVSVIFAGSNTLLKTIKQTGRGDIYLPGSHSFIRKADSLIVSDYYVVNHTPTFAVHRDNSRSFQHYADLLAEGVEIGTVNQEMAALGRTARIINQRASEADQFGNNVVIHSNTVNELFDLLVERKVDAALIWKDMLYWEGGSVLVEIPIPERLIQADRIHVATLSTSFHPKQAEHFARFMTTVGKEIFHQHGF